MTANNDCRSRRAEATLFFYITEQLCEASNPASHEENLTDMLTDLKHLAASNNADFCKCLRMAEINFDAEIAEEADHEQQA